MEEDDEHVVILMDRIDNCKPEIRDLFLQRSVTKFEMEFDKDEKLRFPYKSGIQNWNENDVIGNELPPPPSHGISNLPTELDKIDMSKRIDEIAKALEDTDILLLESPYGSGKSILAPFLMQNLARKISSDGNIFPKYSRNRNWKVAHAGPLGESLMQNCDFLKKVIIENKKEKECDDIVFGYYTTTVNDENVAEKKNVPGEANYVFCTSFYGNQLFDGLLHALVIDDVQEFTPGLMQILHQTKKAFEAEKSDRKINKILLISAILSDFARDKLSSYFTKDGNINFNILKFDDTPFENKTVHLSSDSHPVVKALEDYKRDDGMYVTEVRNKTTIPNSDALRGRSIAIQNELFKHLELDFAKNDTVGNLPGMICFFPGYKDVENAKNALINSREWKKKSKDSNLKKWTASSFTVMGSDKADSPCLMKVYDEGDPVRVIDLTHLLSLGVTFPGVGVVVDDGTYTLMGKYNKNGIMSVDLVFNDTTMIERKKGRVGRQGDGIYFSVVSMKRFREMMISDHTLTRLDRAYRTNDIPFILENRGKMMIEPESDTLKELLQDMDNTGFLVKENERKLKCTSYGKFLSLSFNDLSLVQGDFILRCFTLGIGLHGIIYVACCKIQFRCFRSGQDNELPTKLWHDLTKAEFESDIELCSEMALNLLISGPLGKKMKMEKDKKVKKTFLVNQVNFISMDGIYELYRMVIRIFGNCREILNLSMDVFEFICDQLKREYATEEFPVYTNRTMMISRLNPDAALVFRSNVLQSFGSRMAYERTNHDDRDIKRTYYIGGKMNKVKTRHVQGVVPVKSQFKLCCYDEVMQYNGNNYLTGALHFASATHFALYGNVVGCSRDEVDKENFTLKIRTNTAPLYFKFEDLKSMQDVIRVRRILRWLPISEIIHGKNTSNDSIHMEFKRKLRTFLRTVHEKNDFPTLCFGRESYGRRTFKKVSNDINTVIDFNGPLMLSILKPETSEPSRKKTISMSSSVSATSFPESLRKMNNYGSTESLNSIASKFAMDNIHRVNVPTSRAKTESMSSSVSASSFIGGFLTSANETTRTESTQASPSVIYNEFLDEGKTEQFKKIPSIIMTAAELENTLTDPFYQLDSYAIVEYISKHAKCDWERINMLMKWCRPIIHKSLGPFEIRDGKILYKQATGIFHQPEDRSKIVHRSDEKMKMDVDNKMNNIDRCDTKHGNGIVSKNESNEVDKKSDVKKEKKDGNNKLLLIDENERNPDSKLWFSRKMMLQTMSKENSEKWWKDHFEKMKKPDRIHYKSHESDYDPEQDQNSALWVARLIMVKSMSETDQEAFWNEHFEKMSR